MGRKILQLDTLYFYRKEKFSSSQYFMSGKKMAQLEKIANITKEILLEISLKYLFFVNLL